jgi:hypothetical protein
VKTSHRPSLALLVLGCCALPALAACSNASSSTLPAASCETAAAVALRGCVGETNAATRACYLAGGTACDRNDPAIVAARAAIGEQIAAGCANDEAVRAAGYGPLFTVATLRERLEAACVAETRALAARAFGGPQGAALAAADERDRTCLASAHAQGEEILSAGQTLRTDCVAAARSGQECDPAGVEGEIARVEANAITETAATCGDLSSLVALDPAEFVARTDQQAQCLTAIAHPDTAPLDVACGPRDAVPPVPRGEWTQVVLDEAVFGTRCGDGSPYAFQLWLAPAGSPPENVVVGMEGGGVCVFENDCASRPADLFEALSDPPFELGPLSNDPGLNPFASWTKVFLPYCTQDVFIGGGATSDFPSITVHRFGAVNVRAALEVVRDLVWHELDRESAEGYRPDRMRVLFGGFSAGAFGTLYNVHFVLDDLQWSHTAAYPDAGLALDNGEALGVRGLGAIVASDTPPIGWGAKSFLPPYCFATDCGVGPVMLAATAARLREVPEQQFLILSNQVDGVQVATTFFDGIASWVNALRDSYCATRELNGVHYYLPAIPESIHVISPRPELYADTPVDGEIMRDWLASGFSAPDTVVSRVVEGTLVEDFPGVEPFPCPVAP